jgi:glycerol-3-phosphate dehydrogenase
VVLHAVRDGRVMFVIPWGEQALVGTTDTDHTGGPETPPTVDPEDVAYLLETLNHYFPAARIRPEDVVSAFAGLRPLVAPMSGEGVDPSDVSREEDVFTSPAGLISLAGGKLTTYRLVSAAVVDRVVRALRRTGVTRAISRSRTGAVPLPGGARPPADLAAAALSNDGHGLLPAVVAHLAGRYGTRMDAVLGLAGRDRALAAPIAFPLLDPRAEVVVAVEREWALTLEDVLRRRTQVALTDPGGASTAAPDVARLMATELGWSQETTRAAAEEYVAAVDRERRRWR